MFKIAIVAAAVIVAPGCSPSATPEPSAPVGLARELRLPPDPAASEGKSCALLYGVAGIKLGLDSDAVYRVVAKGLYGNEIFAIEDAFAQEEFIVSKLPLIKMHVEQTIDNPMSVILDHEQEPARSRVLGSYDLTTRGFRPAGLFMLDGYTKHFYVFSNNSTCNIKFTYEKPFVGPVGSPRLPLADQAVARKVESHRVNNDLRLRFIVEPVSIDDRYLNSVVLIREIQFESKSGVALGKADRLPGE